MAKTWLAVGDEAGNWDEVGKAAARQDHRVIGASLTLAPLHTWAGLDREQIGGRTLLDRMANPLQSLPPSAKKSRNHHVKDALPYLGGGRGQPRRWSLHGQPEDPLAAELLDNLRWLATHSGFITVGAYGPLSEILRLHRGQDPAQALGVLYGYLTALVFPFLGAEDRLQVSPGLRSEHTTDNVADQRSQTSFESYGDERPHGDTRGMLTALQDTVLRLVEPWEPTPGTCQQRLEVGTFHHLKGHGWPRGMDYGALNGVADLGASLLSMSCIPSYSIQLPAEELQAGNVRFYPLGDLCGKASGIKTRVALPVQPPVPARALAGAAFPLEVELPPLRLGLAPPGASARTPLDRALHGLGLRLAVQPPDPAALRQGIPYPWRSLELAPDERTIQCALTVTAAQALHLAVPLGERRRDPARACRQVEALPDLDRRVREAIGFALVDLGVEWQRGERLLSHWEHAVRAVLHDRGPCPPIPDCPVPLLRDGFALLERIGGLRQRPIGFDDIAAAWDEFLAAASEPPPAAFGLVFWSEASYRLSEQGEFAPAQSCLDHAAEQGHTLEAYLPGIQEDLKGGMWWHHRGRLAYYSGDFAAALGLYGSEWRFHQRLDSARQARLGRNIAGVLTDMGYLRLAEEFSRQALAIQQANLDPERFKTAGRLGEILLRQGRFDQAIRAFEDSEQAQEAGQSGQTAVYLGHTLLLAGRHDQAKQWYQRAEERDKAHGGGWNPYLWMGRAALYLRTAQEEELELLGELYADELADLAHTKVLPAAVIATALYRAGKFTAETLLEYAERLVNENYASEALLPLSLACPSPADARRPLRHIKALLADWQRAYVDFSAKAGVAGGPATTEQRDPEALLAAIGQAERDDRWEPLQPLAGAVYPMSLVAP